MANKSRNVAIIGLGTFGVSVARELTRMGDNVLGIDDDPARVSMICDEIKSSIQVDATDDKALSQCALETYDAVLVSIGENTEASILAAMNVIELGCRQVWVKAQTETQRKILKAIGVHHVVLPEQRFGTHIAQIIHNPHLEDFISLGDGQYIVIIITQILRCNIICCETIFGIASSCLTGTAVFKLDYSWCINVDLTCRIH